MLWNTELNNSREFVARDGKHAKLFHTQKLLLEQKEIECRWWQAACPTKKARPGHDNGFS